MNPRANLVHSPSDHGRTLWDGEKSATFHCYLQCSAKCLQMADQILNDGLKPIAAVSLPDLQLPLWPNHPHSRLPTTTFPRRLGNDYPPTPVSHIPAASRSRPESATYSALIPSRSHSRAMPGSSKTRTSASTNSLFIQTSQTIHWSSVTTAMRRKS